MYKSRRHRVPSIIFWLWPSHSYFSAKPVSHVLCFFDCSFSSKLQVLRVFLNTSSSMSDTDDGYETPGANDEMNREDMRNWLKVFGNEYESESDGEC